MVHRPYKGKQIMNKKQTCAKIVEILKNQYPDALCSLQYSDPIQLIIAVRLSAQCTDARVNMVTPGLFAALPDVDAFCNSDISEIEKHIQSCGLYRTKAKDIKNMCLMIRDEFGGKLPDNMDDLLRLPGVGRKTANLIMGDVYGQPAIVADTHCIRISGRLGLTDSKDPYKVEMQLRKIIEPSEGSDFCHRIVLFGRDICSARAPKCDICPLSELCPTYKKQKD